MAAEIRFKAKVTVFPPGECPIIEGEKGVFRLEIKSKEENEPEIFSLTAEIIRQIESQNIHYTSYLKECFITRKNPNSKRKPYALNIFTSPSSHEDSVKKIIEIVKQNPRLEVIFR